MRLFRVIDDDPPFPENIEDIRATLREIDDHRNALDELERALRSTVALAAADRDELRVGADIHAPAADSRSRETTLAEGVAGEELELLASSDDDDVPPRRDTEDPSVDADG